MFLQTFQIQIYYVSFRHIYDIPFNCNSHVVSFIGKNDTIKYGNIIIFFSTETEKYSLIQKYSSFKEQMSDFVDLPNELHHSINIFFPIVTLTNNFSIVPLTNIRRKCVRVDMFGSFCISEIRLDYEHD